MKESTFKFTNPYVYDLHFEDNVDFDPKRFENISVKLETNIQKENVELDNEAWVSVCLKIGYTSYDPFNVSIALRALFSWENSLEDRMVNDLLSQNAVALLISYARPIVANITSFSRYPTFNIPFLDISDNNNLEN